jgi:HEAT repeat protein
MSAPARPEILDFEAALRRLAEPGAPPVTGLVTRLSSPTPSDVTLFRELWRALPEARRRWLAHELVATAEADFQVDFKRLFATLLHDGDPEVRAAAIAGLWEARDIALMDAFTTMLVDDADPTVRAHAATALGPFVEQAQLGRLNPELVRRSIDALVAVAEDDGEDANVRRRAIESAGYVDSDEVGSLIEDALTSPERALRAGAVRAMGNSADERWSDDVLDALAAPDPELRYEAARASGELLLAAAVPQLVALAAGNDREIQIEAIWALGEIGGSQSRRALDHLLASDLDEDLAEAVEDALACVALADGEMWWDGLVEPG